MPGQNEYGHCGKTCPKQGPTKPPKQGLSELLSSRTLYVFYFLLKYGFCNKSFRKTEPLTP